MTLAATADGALTGVRVLDLTRALGGAFCTATLGRMGATVVRVEVSGGGAGAEPAFLDAELSKSDVYRAYLNPAEPARAIDLGNVAGVDDLRTLALDCDLVIEDGREPLLEMVGIDVTSGHSDEVPIVVSITPYGRSGPRRDDVASDLTLFHGAGPGHAVPGLVADPATMPPLRLGSHQGSFVSGLVAAMNACAALHARRRAASGAQVRADVSCHEALANSYRQSLGTFAFYGGGTGRELARGRGAGGTADHRNIKCKDGYINIAWGGVQQWDSLKGLLGNPEWAEDPDLATPPLRYRNWTKVQPRLEEWAADMEKEHILYLCQGWRVPSAPVNDGAELIGAPVLASRGFWTQATEDGRGATLPGRMVQRSYPSTGSAR